jgi:predicted SAM-dependent methyltransferase
MIEHIPYAKGNNMLRESFRVLKNGGRIRITTPDLAFLISLYRADKSELQKEYIWRSPQLFPDIYPLGQDTFIINGFVRAWGHEFIYDEKVLRHSLEAAGFKEITSLDLNKSEIAELNELENERRMPAGFLQLESFTLEGIKRVTRESASNERQGI